MLSKVESELAEDQQKEEQKQQRLKEQIQEEKRQRFSQLNAWKVRKVAILKTKSDIQNIFDENILDKCVCMLIKFFFVWFICFKYGIPGPEGIRKSSGRGKEITGSIGQSTERRR